MSQETKRKARCYGGPANGRTHEFYTDYTFDCNPPETDVVSYVRAGRKKDEDGYEIWVVDASDKE